MKRLIVILALSTALLSGGATVPASVTVPAERRTKGLSYRLVYFSQWDNPKRSTSRCEVSAEGSFEDYLPCAWQFARDLASIRYGNEALKAIDRMPAPPVEMSMGYITCGDVISQGCFSAGPERAPTIRAGNVGDLTQWWCICVHEYFHFIIYNLNVPYDDESAWLDSIPDICNAWKEIKPRIDIQ